jgi:hypothetical protein
MEAWRERAQDWALIIALFAMQNGVEPSCFATILRPESTCEQ